MASTDQDILPIFLNQGFSGLGADAMKLRNQLEAAACHTGEASYVFLAQAVHGVDTLRQEHEERGGIRSRFLDKLDRATLDMASMIRNGTAAEQARTGKAYRDRILALVSEYDAIND